MFVLMLVAFVVLVVAVVVVVIVVVVVVVVVVWGKHLRFFGGRPQGTRHVEVCSPRTAWTTQDLSSVYSSKHCGRQAGAM